MPLLSATETSAVWCCLGCGYEGQLHPGDWKVDDDLDSSSLTTPPCPDCGAVESFSWHDWVYVTERPPDPDDPRGPGTVEPDPEHPGAKQMVLIERVARARGRRRRTMPEQRATAYPSAPRVPSVDEVRAYARRIRR
jgi:hypothetical protein